MAIEKSEHAGFNPVQEPDVHDAHARVVSGVEGAFWRVTAHDNWHRVLINLFTTVTNLSPSSFVMSWKVLSAICFKD